MSTTDQPARPDQPDSYLPDFCSGRMVLAIVLIAELVAIILTLSRPNVVGTFWTELARISMFLLWAGMGSAAVLCVARPWLAPLSVTTTTVISLALLLATIGLLSEVTYFLGERYSERVIGSDIFPGNHGSFVGRNLGIAAIVGSLMLRYFYVAHQWRRNVELEARARIRALQARIRPHFLFNSMNTIASLTRSDPAEAERAIEDLADLFRSSLADSSQRIRLKEELELARIYQRIEQLRLGNRLTVEWHVDKLPMRALVPGLSIQPLLENAIYHGIETLPDGGTVSIEGSVNDKIATIEIRNPVLVNDDAPARNGNKIALKNIQDRFALAYDGRARVSTGVAGGQFSVRLDFPVVE